MLAPAAQPAQAGAGAGARAVLAAHEAGVAQLVQAAKEVRVVDLAVVGFVAVGHACDLDVADAAQVPFEPAREVALADLAVIEVHLHAQVGRAHLSHHVVRLLLRGEEVARCVAPIERFDQQRDAQRRHARGGLAQVGHVGGVQAGPVGALGHDAGHGVQALAAGGLGVAQGRFQVGGEFGLAAREAGHAALADGLVARRQVEQGLREAVVAQAARDLVGVELVREQVLDGVEAIGGGCGEALQEGHFGVHQREVGGESGHVTRGC